MTEKWQYQELFAPWLLSPSKPIITSDIHTLYYFRIWLPIRGDIRIIKSSPGSDTPPMVFGRAVDPDPDLLGSKVICMLGSVDVWRIWIRIRNEYFFLRMLLVFFTYWNIYTLIFWNRQNSARTSKGEVGPNDSSFNCVPHPELTKKLHPDLDLKKILSYPWHPTDFRKKFASLSTSLKGLAF